jgi:hypothetical protein
MRIRLSSKLVNHTCRAESCQPVADTGFPPVLHSTGEALGELTGSHDAQQHAASARSSERQFRRAPRQKQVNIVKDPIWRFFLKEPFGKLCSRITAPWPELIQSVSSAYYFGCRTRTRVAQKMSSEPHTALDVLIYTTVAALCARENQEWQQIPEVRPEQASCSPRSSVSRKSDRRWWIPIRRCYCCCRPTLAAACRLRPRHARLLHQRREC